MGLKEDLRVWLGVLEEFNWIPFWWEELCLRSELQVQVDPAGSSGYGSFSKVSAVHGRSPAEWNIQGVIRDLTFLKLFPVIGASWLWAHECANSVVMF